MSTLSKEYRRQLENAVLKAREEAERGAAAALESYGVGETRKPTHLDKAGEDLRKKLRAHGRQVGDVRRPDESQEVKRLVHECAYVHWHRILFARFLAENGFLIEPESGLDVDLDFCEEQARENNSDKWEVAAGFAQRMLTGVFRAGDPVLQVRLPTEFRNRLTALLTSLPQDLFLASDSLGWVYQFWQAKKKEEVNAAGNKIGADELPSVTQLFTEDYMVDFLLDNTLGAWWAGKKLTAENAKNAEFKTEEEVRQFCALPGCPWKYLRFIKSESVSAVSAISAVKSSWLPAAGTYDGWPKSAKELKCLDPCMGSGHFVVALFERLVALRLAEEKLDEAAAVAAVIRDNLFGLEIDPRCTQIGAFNLALAAWRRVGHCKLPAMNLACSGLAPNAKLDDWLAIVVAASSRTLTNAQKRQDAAPTVVAASSRTGERLEAPATFAPINYFRPDEPVAHLTGNLPHWRQTGTTYFVTFRCADALPQEKLHQWQQELEQWQAAHPEPHDEATRQEFYERFPKRIQTWLDSGYGECVLREPAMRQIVESAMRHFDGQRYRLAEFVVAANHVHALVTPLGEHLLSEILHSWKSFTANKINEARKKSGAFWQKESFDHIVRSPASLAKFREYILSHNKVQILEGSATPSVVAASSRSSSLVAALSRSQPEEERLEAAATMRLRAGMERLYRLFQKAPVLGSLINPRADEGDLLVAAFHELQPLLEKALAQETKDDSAREMAVTARGLAKAAEILAGQFTLVATNVPYLLARKQCQTLKEWCDRYHAEAKADLATAFVQRGLAFSATGGSVALVTPQNWLYLGSSKKLREALLKDATWNLVARLGPGAFETIGGEVVNVALLAITGQLPTVVDQLVGLDAAEEESPVGKGAALREKPLIIIPQHAQLENPDARILVGEGSSLPLLEKYSIALNGMHGGDAQRFRFFFWEVDDWQMWTPFQGTCESTMPYSGREHVFFWPEAGKIHHENPQAFVKGYAAWGKRGVVVNMMGQLPASLYSGEKFDISCTPIVPHDSDHLPAIWAFCSSLDFSSSVRQIDQSLKVTNATLVKIPFDLARWQKVAAEKYPHGLPKPFSSDPTQWLFNGHPKQQAGPEFQTTEHTEYTERKDKASSPSPSLCSVYSVVHSTSLQVAVARLVGYRWPRQTGSSFPDCPALGPDGLEKHGDHDGVVCFSQARDEAPAATRLRALLADAYGSEWSHAMERKLIAATGSKADSLEEWLVNDFFEQHCDMFHNRPFVWHLWDGRKDGFNVLVNYHRLAAKSEVRSQKSEGKTATHYPGPLPDRGGEGESHAGLRTLESLTYAYLGDWIGRQRDAVKRDEAGAEDRLAAALELQGELKKIIAGEPPYDLFIRWKALHEQSIGWEPDINDGVRLNCRPFVAATLSRGKKGAGLFRAKFNVKWEKDRGKEPMRPEADFPWFWKWDERTVDFGGSGEFDGNRWNDCHYTTAFKRAVRERKK